MKWMLIVMVLNRAPVETGLLYDSLSDCLIIENQARNAYAEQYNKVYDWAKERYADDKAEFDRIKHNSDLQLLHNVMTCVPHE